MEEEYSGAQNENNDQEVDDLVVEYAPRRLISEKYGDRYTGVPLCIEKVGDFFDINEVSFNNNDNNDIVIAFL